MTEENEANKSRIHYVPVSNSLRSKCLRRQHKWRVLSLNEQSSSSSSSSSTTKGFIDRFWNDSIKDTPGLAWRLHIWRFRTAWPALGDCRSHPGCGCSPECGTPWCDYLREKMGRKHLKYICLEVEFVTHEAVGRNSRCAFESTEVERCDQDQVVSTAAEAARNQMTEKR